ncbi:MutS domain V [Marinitoga hydrogenitolerans DSM 16785]|uniref:MutS domain V n=1 Tax=Marinitoga hydrogenitolerans (strain DSM 16785 / JCM 12826 / AT1271) TaxID=1122195 RepID=A0A1M4Z497_MARH1|nr:DNA mismatch repair protein MutS [Marinitoga hydrogenitolerans]SHF12416.1 MutS domain V [Marinitoga hydrogenitolerans DSM 16785]
MLEINYLLNKLEIITPLGQKSVKNIKFFTNNNQIQKELEKIEETISFIISQKEIVEKIKNNLMYIKDISKTLERLTGDYILDDIELYEIKYFSIYYEKIREMVHFSYLKLPNLEKIISILDPDGNKLPTFYIYDSYSEQLAKIRKKRKTAIEKEKEILYIKELEIENKIREKLSIELKKYIKELNQALKDISELDFVLAKSKLAIEYGFTKPEISNHIKYKKLFNPLIKNNLEKEYKTYQPIDIELYNGVTLITGANMTGKTVILRTLVLAQYLFQYGFYVPAKYAELKVVKKIFLISGDYQSTLNGLSSYAAEMLKLNEILKYIKEKNNAMILLDELARNTNPHEGKLIVKSVIEILNKHNSVSLITTHFNNVAREKIRKLRIKGIKKDKLKENITPENITEIIDYSLIEEKNEIVPEEALTIAKLLKIDDELIETIERLKKEEIFHE